MTDPPAPEAKGSRWVRCVGISSRVPGTDLSVLFVDMDGATRDQAKACAQWLLETGFTHALALRTDHGHHVISFDAHNAQHLLATQEALIERGWQDARHADQLRQHGRNVLRVSRKPGGRPITSSWGAYTGRTWVWSQPHVRFYDSLVGLNPWVGWDPTYAIGTSVDLEVYYTPRKEATHG